MLFGLAFMSAPLGEVVSGTHVYVDKKVRRVVLNLGIIKFCKDEVIKVAIPVPVADAIIAAASPSEQVISLVEDEPDALDGAFSAQFEAIDIFVPWAPSWKAAPTDDALYTAILEGPDAIRCESNGDHRTLLPGEQVKAQSPDGRRFIVTGTSLGLAMVHDKSTRRGDNHEGFAWFATKGLRYTYLIPRELDSVEALVHVIGSAHGEPNIGDRVAYLGSSFDIQANQ